MKFGVLTDVVHLVPYEENLAESSVHSDPLPGFS